MMRKYLMTGLAAVALSGLFSSCSKDIETGEENTVEFNILQTYEDAFVTRFGQPSEDQDWGFGTFVAGTRGTFSNGNEWAANDRADCMYRVPPKLTDDQIKIVRIYFQSVQDPDYDDPGWTNYFIQQVYKGGSNPGPNSTEKYKAADNNTDIIGSDHMDHLAAINGDFVDHNKNFNNGDCGEYGNVLDYEGTLTRVDATYPVNSGDDHRHADKINLMTNSTTASFGYYNSNSSIRRTEYTGLVSWSTIKTWANANGHYGEADCLDDGWNRSFMGFDFEMLVDEEVYSYTKYDADGNVVYSNEYHHKVPNYFSVELPNGNEDVWNGTTYVKANTVGEVVTDAYGNKKLYPYFPGTTEKVGLLSSNSNEYAGTRDPDWNGTDWERYEGSTKHLSIEKLIPALQANKLPLNQYNWVTIGGTADHYYSDWIVTLTEAKKYDTPNPPVDPPSGFVCRIIAEDLTVGENSDFDFNDVVFDVIEGGTVLRLRAAGGELPLWVAGHEVHAAFAEKYPNDGITRTTLINTGWKGSTLDYNNYYVDISSGGTYSTPEEANNIVVQVEKKGQTITLEAKRAKVASKVCVGPDYKWCAEREDIDAKYHKADGTKLFQQYVIGNLGDDWVNGNAWYQQK